MSGSALDMTLDDLIKTNKTTSRRGRGRADAPGPVRRQFKRSANRSAPYATPEAPETAWGHDMFAGGGSGIRTSSIETGTKLYISNLDYGVSNDDIKELFAEVGDLKRYTVHYDRSGRSKGTADVVFSRRQDALAAIKKYNNIQLDGKPMKIELVGANLSTPGVGPSAGAFVASDGAPRSRQARGGFGRQARGGGRGRGRGRGRGSGGRGRGENISADDLDADLDKYHAGAMDTN